MLTVVSEFSLEMGVQWMERVFKELWARNSSALCSVLEDVGTRVRQFCV